MWSHVSPSRPLETNERLDQLRTCAKAPRLTLWRADEQAGSLAQGATLPVGSNKRSGVGQHPGVDLVGGRVAPHDVADPVVVEVTDADRDPTGGMRSDIDAARPLAVVDLPDVDRVGRRVVPDDVIDAV